MHHSRAQLKIESTYLFTYTNFFNFCNVELCLYFSYACDMAQREESNYAV